MRGDTLPCLSLASASARLCRAYLPRFQLAKSKSDNPSSASEVASLQAGSYSARFCSAAFLLALTQEGRRAATIKPWRNPRADIALAFMPADFSTRHVRQLFFPPRPRAKLSSVVGVAQLVERRSVAYRLY